VTRNTHQPPEPAPSTSVDWSRFDTAAHRAAQAACRHVIACAVGGATRKAVAEHVDYARSIGDVAALPVLIARLTGPCTLPPADGERVDPHAGRSQALVAQVIAPPPQPGARPPQVAVTADAVRITPVHQTG
jgi:hypothetical protein